MRDNLDNDKEEQVRYDDKNRKQDKRVETKNERKQVSDNVDRCSMVYPCIGLFRKPSPPSPYLEFLDYSLYH